MSYFLAPSLKRLRDEINTRWPKRDKSSDGWIGDTSHSARKSDHNPDWSAPGKRKGVVRATDTDIDGNKAGDDLSKAILEATIGDPRVWYVIHKGRIYSRTHGFKPKKYAGNPHTKHVHVSLVHSAAAENSTARWMPAGPKAAVPAAAKVLPKIVLPLVQDQFTKSLAGKPVQANSSILRLQTALNLRHGSKLKVDGIVGPKTIWEWGDFCKKIGRRGKVLGKPAHAELRRLVGGMYTVTG